MPIHDIKCLKCNSINELLIHNTSELKCPECGSTSVEKLISATSSIRSFSAPTIGSSCCGSTPDKANCEGPGSCCGNISK